MHTPEYTALNDRNQLRELNGTNLPLVGEDAASREVAVLYQHFRSQFGRSRVPGILQCFATHPPLLEHMIGIAEGLLFSEGALGRQTKELIATFISSANQCAYCADSHGFFLREHGGSEDLLQAALSCRETSPALTKPEQSMLAFCRKINENSAAIAPSDIDALRGDGWSDLEISEAVHLTALFATFNRVVNAFGVPSQNLLISPAAQGIGAP
jgi:uncharacterized peroxidase-related enzyme